MENHSLWIKQLVNSSHIGILIVDENRKNVFLNSRLAQMFGYSEKKLLASTADILHRDEEAFLEFGELAFKSVLNGKSVSMEYQFKRKDGSLFWAHVSGDPVQNQKEVLWTLVDITLQKDAQKVATDRFNLLDSVVNATPNFIFYIDYLNADGKYMGCNDAFKAFTGKECPEIVGFSDEELFGKEEGEKYRKKDKEVMASKKASITEEFFVLPNAEKLTFSVTRTPFYNNKNEMVGILRVARDITEEKKRQLKLIEQAQMIDQTYDSVISINLDGLIQTWNRGAERMLGYTAQETIGKDVSMLHPKEEYEKILTTVDETMEKGTGVVDVVHLTKSKELITLSLSMSVLRNKDGIITGVVGYGQDVRKRKEMEEALKEERRHLESIIDGMNDPIMVIRDDYNIEVMNKSLRESLKNVELADPKNPKCYEVSHNRSTPCDGVSHPCPLKSVLETKEHAKVIHTHQNEKGEEIFVELSADPYLNTQGECIGIIESSRDITKHLQTQNDLTIQKNILNHQAHHDALTGLPNRVLFEDRVKQSLEKSKRKGTKTALLFIDLDHFKEINDSLGHQTGDEVLKIVTKRLSKTIRNEDTLARLGGDEFTIILGDIKDSQDASLVAKNILQSLSESMEINENKLYVSTSIGISIFPDDGQDAENLVKYADSAMYKAKDEGRNNFQYYNEGLTELAFERVFMEASLRDALKQEEFIVYYQPQVDGESEKLIGMEALVRWNHPNMGILAPSKFIVLAERTGLIVDIDRFVMKTAMSQFAQWYKMGLNPGILALNLSVKQLEKEDFFKVFAKLLEETACKPEWIELEVTESQIMTRPEESIKVLQKISDLGIELAIDDFGTGYSSLAYLKRLPIDKLKIDQTFIRDLPDDEEDAGITKAVIALAKSLNLKIIAEGVETQAQKDFVVMHGCANIQGYFYSRPITAKKMEVMLEKGGVLNV